MQMQRDTAALMAHLKLHNTAQSKLDLLGKMIAASPGISAAGLRQAMDKVEINPATKECANQWLAEQSTTSIAADKIDPPKAPVVTKPKVTRPKAPAVEPAGSD